MKSWRMDVRQMQRVQRAVAFGVALFLAAYFTRGLVLRQDTKSPVVKPKPPEPPEKRAERERCERVRQRLGVALDYYVKRTAPYDQNLIDLLKPLFPEKHLVIWSSQANAGPLLDLRPLLEPLGVDFIEHTVQHNCRQLCDCRAPSPEIEAATAGLVRPNHRFEDDTAAAFRSALANFSNFSRIDAFFSAYPFSFFEYYMPFNRSIIAIAHTRMEMGREELLHWNALNANVRALYGKPQHVLGAASAYDRAYIAHFTGLSVDLVPMFGLHTAVTYNPAFESYLLAIRPGGAWGRWFNETLRKALAKYKQKEASDKEVKLVDAFPSDFEYDRLGAHRGLVYVPVSTTSLRFVETYSMCVPMFVPSVTLLLKWWNEQRYLLRSRTLQGELHDRHAGGSLQRADAAHENEADPNNEWDVQMVREWLQYADFVKMPELMQFDSVKHLAELLAESTHDFLVTISQNMCARNREKLRQLLIYWRRRLADIAEFSPNRPH